MPNEGPSSTTIACLLMQSTDKFSLEKNKDTLAMAAALESDQYLHITLTPSQRLYCDLLRISDKIKHYLANHLELSETGKVKLEEKCSELAERYSSVFSKLWENAQENYSDIEELSNCLYKTNQILPNEQKIRPQFSDKTFSYSENNVPPGDFCYFDMKNIEFIDVCFSEWSSDNLKGACFDSCHFSTSSLCEMDTFDKAEDFTNCMFGNVVNELSPYVTVDSQERLTSEGGSTATDLNNFLIDKSREKYLETKELRERNIKLEEENQGLKDQLKLLDNQATSTSHSISFFRA